MLFFKCILLVPYIFFRADQMAQLLDEQDLGVLTSSLSLLVALVSNSYEAYWICLPKCVKILERLVRNQDIPQEYTNYGIPSPWLQVYYFSVFTQNISMSALLKFEFPFFNDAYQLCIVWWFILEM